MDQGLTTETLKIFLSDALILAKNSTTYTTYTTYATYM